MKFRLVGRLSIQTLISQPSVSNRSLQSCCTITPTSTCKTLVVPPRQLLARNFSQVSPLSTVLHRTPSLLSRCSRQNISQPSHRRELLPSITVNSGIEPVSKYREHCANFHTMQGTTVGHSNSTVCHSQPVKQMYTVSGLASTLWEHIGFPKRLKHRKYVLRRSALRLYLCCVELVDQDAFIREFNLPDTFNSWFRVTELHIWLCMVRLDQEGKEGTILRNFLVEYFWKDLDKKIRKLSMMSAKVRRDGIQDMSEMFKFSLFSYDEGLLSDDKVLAGALWRTIFEGSCDDPHHLETMVRYVRKQVVHLDEMDSSVLQTAGIFTFLPLHESTEAIERNKHILVQIAKRV